MKAYGGVDVNKGILNLEVRTPARNSHKHVSA
jgi:hypothetical protein